VRAHTKDVHYKDYIHHAKVDDPRYEIRSDKTDHIALHKDRALRLLAADRRVVFRAAASFKGTLACALMRA
jgi:Hypervirulence associated proteins TUDOR domain